MKSNDEAQKCNMIMVISKNEKVECVNLPTEESEFHKALERLGAKFEDCKCQLDYLDMPPYLGDILKQNVSFENLNYFAKALINDSSQDLKYLQEVAQMANVGSNEDLKTVLRCRYEFEIYSDVEDEEQYGRYMICDSGHFDIEEGLYPFIDFEGYGQSRVQEEKGRFVGDGYIAYLGYDKAAIELLERNLSADNVYQLKLYMPLMVLTYVVETEYGDEVQNHLVDVDNSEILNEIEIIRSALKNAMAELNSKRGLMDFYLGDYNVDTKVKSFNFDIEEVDGEVVGVAVLELDAKLTSFELEQMKDYIRVQASDGFGEVFEQMEIQTCTKPIYVSLWKPRDWSLKEGDYKILKQEDENPNQGFTLSME